MFPATNESDQVLCVADSLATVLSSIPLSVPKRVQVGTTKNKVDNMSIVKKTASG